ncbi:NAD(P)H-binding protein [Altererythrobacter xixiisoli]|uniref:NAD(P)H-binding protein n=1 Tax=Croceibacterium xixiisoli TaxID=1476466 RepID=A0A6I4TTB1_9SPHN|nr:NAD(P)H-binding protein [Croceibacterium xixiisoli]MXO99405.1 NAD(P)H-binding protein [Croceibacterium xixiisoli]
MAERRRILLVGASGLIGGAVMRQSMTTPGMRLIALGRRETPLPPGARMEMVVADTLGWGDAIAAISPNSAICALGSTWAKSGRNEAAFRAVDHDLVLAVAQTCRDNGVENFVLVSSVGAEISSRTLYLRVKAETEAAVGRLGFRRLDILRPGLLRGTRQNDTRVLERLAMLVSPLADRLMTGERRRYRSIAADDVAQAALTGAMSRAGGRFTHEHDAIERLARKEDRR